MQETAISALEYKYLVSVVVCTHNRSRLLHDCLWSLVRQTADNSTFEVIVVDNNSTDATPAVVQTFSETLENVRYVRETRTGLSHARNCGMQEALGEYIAYIDDDAEAFPDWVEQIAAFIARHGTVVACGGPCEPKTESPVPPWFPPEFGRFSLGDEVRSLNAATEFIVGFNMVFKAEVLREVGGFNTSLGMTGSTIAYGEETRLQIDLKRRGHEIYYVPSIRVKHLIARHKISFRWLIRSVYAVGKSSDETFCTERTWLSCLRGIAYGCYHATRVLLTQRGIPLKRKLYYGLIPFVSEIGATRQWVRSRRTIPKG